jgi:hypothetical protein
MKAESFGIRTATTSKCGTVSWPRNSRVEGSGALNSGESRREESFIKHVLTLLDIVLKGPVFFSVHYLRAASCCPDGDS